MDQYFASEPQSQSKPVTYTYAYRGRTFEFKTDAGVFSKGETDFGTDLLLNALPELSGRTLDLGCGFGAIGVCLAKTYPADVVLSDVNRRALSLARENLQINGAQAQVIESDGLADIAGTFSQIITNPPIRAGKKVIYSLFAQCKERLLPGGSLYLVIRKQQGADSARAYLEGLFAEVSVLERKKGFYVFRCIKGDGREDQT